MKNAFNQRFTHDDLGSVRFITYGAEASNARTISLQAYAKNGKEMQKRSAFEAYLSSDANGDLVEAVSSTLTITSGTDGQTVARSAGNSLGNTTFLGITESDGDIDITITETSGANTFYLNVIMPNGEIITSAAITFAA